MQPHSTSGVELFPTGNDHGFWCFQIKGRGSDTHPLHSSPSTSEQHRDDILNLQCQNLAAERGTAGNRVNPKRCTMWR
jgi:hypothetical protein